MVAQPRSAARGCEIGHGRIPHSWGLGYSIPHPPPARRGNPAHPSMATWERPTPPWFESPSQPSARRLETLTGRLHNRMESRKKTGPTPVRRAAAGTLPRAFHVRRGLVWHGCCIHGRRSGETSRSGTRKDMTEGWARRLPPHVDARPSRRRAAAARRSRGASLKETRRTHARVPRAGWHGEEVRGRQAPASCQ